MGLILKGGSGGDVDYSPAPAGNHAAVCVWMIDMGHQEWTFQDKPNDGPKVLLGFELDTDEKPDGDLEAFIQAKEYTAYLSEKANLRKDLESWRGKSFTPDELEGFDLRNILGKPCLVNIVHKESKNGRTYARIEGITPLPKGMPAPKPKTPIITFDMDDPDWDVFDELSEYRQEQLKKARNFPDRNAPAAPNPQGNPDNTGDDIEEDSIPF